jgi:hypothetical protein
MNKGDALVRNTLLQSDDVRDHAPTTGIPQNSHRFTSGARRSRECDEAAEDSDPAVTSLEGRIFCESPLKCLIQFAKGMYALAVVFSPLL